MRRKCIFWQSWSLPELFPGLRGAASIAPVSCAVREAQWRWKPGALSKPPCLECLEPLPAPLTPPAQPLPLWWHRWTCRSWSGRCWRRRRCTPGSPPPATVYTSPCRASTRPSARRGCRGGCRSRLRTELGGDTGEANSRPVAPRYSPTSRSATARFRKKKFPCVRRLRSTTNARMTRALPSTVANTSSPMSAASGAAVPAGKGPPAAQELPDRLSHGPARPMVPAETLRRCPDPELGCGTAPPGGARGWAGQPCPVLPSPAQPARCWGRRRFGKTSWGPVAPLRSGECCSTVLPAAEARGSGWAAAARCPLPAPPQPGRDAPSPFAAAAGAMPALFAAPYLSSSPWPSGLPDGLCSAVPGGLCPLALRRSILCLCRALPAAASAFPSGTAPTRLTALPGYSFPQNLQEWGISETSVFKTGNGLGQCSSDVREPVLTTESSTVPKPKPRSSQGRPLARWLRRPGSRRGTQWPPEPAAQAAEVCWLWRPIQKRKYSFTSTLLIWPTGSSSTLKYVTIEGLALPPFPWEFRAGWEHFGILSLKDNRTCSKPMHNLPLIQPLFHMW